MSAIRVTLHREGAEALHAQAIVTPEVMLQNPEFRQAQVTVAVIGDAGQGAVTLPLDLLSALMAKVMSKASSQPAKLVIPNLT